MKNNIEQGLSSKEVIQKRKIEGFNEIIEPSRPFLLKFIKKIMSPIPLMIIVALVLSIIVKHYEDTLIISILLVVNLAVDLFQEQKAHNALLALKKSLALTALVIRNGTQLEVPARELVSGDIVKLTIGSIVPADTRLVDGEELLIDQSAITGESLPATLSKNSTVSAGAIIMRGSARAVVTAIGKNTSMGKNIELVGEAQATEESHFQKAIIKIGKFLIIIASILVVMTSILLLLRGSAPLDVVRFALVLAIASIPVALPAVLSITMAIGAGALAHKNTIVSNFRAIEELAGVNYLCVDKTGTLTKNEIAVSKPIMYGQYTEDELFIFAYLALEDGERSPIEQAIRNYVHKHDYETRIKEYKVKEFHSFDPVKKITEVVLGHKGREIRMIMGAPQIITERLSLKKNREQLEIDVNSLAVDGFRSLALAVELSKGITPVGLISLIDPPREDSKEVVAELKKRGVIVKMLTGDNTAIARYIGRLLNIGTVVSDHDDIINTSKGINKKKIHDTDVFAEVVPEDKFNIVQSFQNQGHIVAMTGDGVNDAPALKKADIGIAVSGATDAARSASDLVLLSRGLSVIKQAIDLARQTFARMEAYATFRISETIRIVLLISLSLLLFNFSLLTAGMIILLALLNDIPVLAIAYDNVPLSDKPVRWKLRETLVVSTVLGVIGLVSSFALLYYLNVSGWELALIQTIFFVKLDVAGHSTLYITRTGHKHFWERPYPAWKFFISSFSSRLIGSTIAYFGFFMPAISFSTIVLIWVYATLWFLINDQVKVFTYKMLDNFSKNKNKQKNVYKKEANIF